MSWLIKIAQRSQNSGPSLMVLRALRTQMCQHAQRVYDIWDQVDGIDEEFGSGGICDQLARELGNVVSMHTPFDIRDGGQDGDDHAYIIVKTPEGYYNVDINPGVYERGGGYSWQKVPDVVFVPNDIDIDYLGDNEEYWGEEEY